MRCGFTKESYMITALTISVITCAGLISSVLLFPKLKIGKITFATYWPICLLGAIFMLVFGAISPSEAWQGLTASSAVNPLKILVLFISSTLLSVYLDEVGFFRFLAVFATKKAKKSQLSLFLILYIVVSILTVFTSNDIVILTFTPFICYFAKHSKINPIPYLVAEFAGANTWSMMLIIGNPTNVYLATSAGIDFIEYFKVMAIPTLLSGIAQLLTLLLIFRKSLKAPLQVSDEEQPLPDFHRAYVGLIHLAVCLILLVISSYIGLEMWLVCLLCALSLCACVVIVSFGKNERPKALGRTVARLPWALIPFVLSMFVLVLALNKQGFTHSVSELLQKGNSLITYGVSSFFACNLMNNIPMSVLFSRITNDLPSVYATIVGSNIGAFLTPIGALAGIMFTGLIAKQDIKYPFPKFVGYGILISLPTLAAALLGLGFIL